MVNYCCVTGCGRNSRISKQLKYYSLPKERHRQEEWLRIAGREDLLEKVPGKATVSLRFCSRHFAPSCTKNHNLCADAVPSLCLPGSQNSQSEDESDIEEVSHSDVICDSCVEPVKGFRYKCVTCDDYDLCPKCEMKETHDHHFMLRIPRPVKFKQADNLVKKWRKLFNTTPDTLDDSDDSSDNEPITKYAKAKHNTSSTDIPEDMKKKIQAEITRVLNLNLGTEDGVTKKRKNEESVKSNKRTKSNSFDEMPGNDIELAFADVNQLNSPFMDSSM